MKERTQKDLDIARMSALKSATELLSSFPDLVPTSSDIEAVTRMTTQVAGFFLNWIQDERKQPETGKPASGTPPPPPGPGRTGGTPGDNGGKNGRYKGLERLAVENGFEDQGWSAFPDGSLPISRKQYGYAVSLYRKLSVDHDPQWLNSLTAKQGSNHIDELKFRIENPDRPPRDINGPSPFA